MSTLSIVRKQETRSSWFSQAGTKLKKFINDLFKPEVVEVTFKMDGDSVTYTYTKVEEKKVA